MQRDYEILDIFTAEALGGNPLAIVHDSAGLDGAAMQAIAREFNLSETVFVSPPDNPAHTARIRIFMPNGELPFAGHPTVGTAIALAARRGFSGPAVLVLEEKVGPVRCAVAMRQGMAFAEFDLPILPSELPFAAEPAMIGAALGLDADQIGFENHRIAKWSAGVPYIMVPVRDLEAAASVRIDEALWRDIAGSQNGKIPAPYIYCRQTVHSEAAFHARMFAPWDGIAEDPATGSAAAAFAGQVMGFERPGGREMVITIEQGVEMGRPSLIRLELELDHGALIGARIGGHAVKIAEGRLLV